MRKCVLAALILLGCWIAPHLKAQTFGRPSLEAGISHNDFRYVTEGCTYRYDFKEQYPVVAFDTKIGILRLGYGTQKADVLRGRPAASIIEVAFSRESTVYLSRRFFTLPAGVYLPFRSTLDYRRTSIERKDVYINVPDLNLLGSTVGTGFGWILQSTHNQPRFTVCITAVSSIGAMTDLSDKGETVIRLVRSAEFDCKLAVARLWRNKHGLVVGFAYRSSRWTDRNPDSFDEVSRSIAHAGEIPKRRGQIEFRLGMTW